MTKKIIEAARDSDLLDPRDVPATVPNEYISALARFYAIARAEALEDAAQACRPFGKTGAVVAAAIKALKEQQNG